MLDRLIADHKDELIAAVTGKLGVDQQQGGGFIDKLIGMVQDKLGTGDLDLAALLSGDLGAIKGSLNLEVLGSALGGDAARGEQGIASIIDPLKDMLGGKAGELGGAEGLLKQITGGDAGGIIDKLGGLGGLGGMLGGKS